MEAGDAEETSEGSGYWGYIKPVSVPAGMSVTVYAAAIDGLWGRGRPQHQPNDPTQLYEATSMASLSYAEHSQNGGAFPHSGPIEPPITQGARSLRGIFPDSPARQPL